MRVESYIWNEINHSLNKEKIMTEKIVKTPKLSKKVLLAEICEKTGKTPAEVQSLSRSNISTIAWIHKLVS